MRFILCGCGLELLALAVSRYCIVIPLIIARVANIDISCKFGIHWNCLNVIILKSKINVLGDYIIVNIKTICCFMFLNPWSVGCNLMKPGNRSLVKDRILGPPFGVILYPLFFSKGLLSWSQNDARYHSGVRSTVAFSSYCWTHFRLSYGYELWEEGQIRAYSKMLANR